MILDRDDGSLSVPIISLPDGTALPALTTPPGLWKDMIDPQIHSLRHSHVRHYVQKVPLAAVQKQVGHKSLQTTEIYLRLADEDVRKAYESVR